MHYEQNIRMDNSKHTTKYNPFSVDRILHKTNKEDISSNKLCPKSSASKMVCQSHSFQYSQRIAVQSTKQFTPIDIDFNTGKYGWFDSNYRPATHADCCFCISACQRYTEKNTPSIPKHQPISRQYLPLRVENIESPPGRKNHDYRLVSNSFARSTLVNWDHDSFSHAIRKSTGSQFPCTSVLRHDGLEQEGASFNFDTLLHQPSSERPLYPQVPRSDNDVDIMPAQHAEEKFDWMTNPRPFYRKDCKRQTRHSNSKRDRTTFSKKQRSELERQFKVNRYPSRYHRSQIATYLDLTEFQIKVWFQNRRMKFKRWNSALRHASVFTSSCCCAHACKASF